MMLRGPNTRLDFHIDPGDEFFYQVEGEMELVVKPEGEGRQTVRINQGEIFVCPGGVPHSPRRFENTWGLVIERSVDRKNRKSLFGSANSATRWFFLVSSIRAISRHKSPPSTRNLTTIRAFVPASPAVMSFRKRPWPSG